MLGNKNIFFKLSFLVLLGQVVFFHKTKLPFAEGLQNRCS